MFSETDGLEDWAEQLFKHEGYCLWDGDKQQQQEGGEDNDDVTEQTDYQFMQNYREEWSQDCQQWEGNGENDNSLYYGVKPLPEGYMTYGVYTDAYCSIEATDMLLEEYMLQYFLSKDYEEEEAQELVEKQLYIIDRWNRRMNDYKVCQPCRAYNRVPVMVQNNRRRNLNDGQGDYEQWGYNCYDDAGYTNCNQVCFCKFLSLLTDFASQCYKFESQTYMTIATAEDMTRASKQGTIVAINVDGRRYGSGGLHSHLEFTGKSLIGLSLFLVLFFTVFFWATRKLLMRRARRCFRTLTQPPEENLKEHLAPGEENAESAAEDLATASEEEESVCFHEIVDDFVDDMSTTSAKDRASAVVDAAEIRISQQQQRIENLQLALDMERVRRDLERDRLKSQLAALQKQLSEKAESENTDANN